MADPPKHEAGDPHGAVGPAAKAQPTRLLRLFDLNPAFGTGTFRRRVRLRHQAGTVVGALDDNNHSMWLRLHHEGGMVDAIEGGFHRWPTTACPSATAVLQELVGTRIDASRDELVADGRARRHCTHLYDLAVLALAMANRADGDRVWDAAVPDPQDGRTTATITLDGELVHEWAILNQSIVPSDGSAPQSLLTGFTPWALARFSGASFEAATILRMTAFTARARAHIPDNRPWPLADFPERLNACHAYSPPQQSTATHRVNVVRDFSAGIIEPSLPPISAIVRQRVQEMRLRPDRSLSVRAKLR